jgi:hypothetical protein
LKAYPSLSQYRLPISTYNFINNIILIGPWNNIISLNFSTWKLIK